jgi:hypothetical protein
MENKEYKEIKGWWNLEGCVKDLLRHKAKGELVKGNFNGHWLYSDTVTMDSAYLEVTGKTFDDYKKYEEERQSLIKKMEEKKQTAKENIPNWIDRGHKLFPQEKWKEWDEVVPIRAGDLYNGIELDNTLEIQEILIPVDSNNKEKIFETTRKRMKAQGHSGMSWSLVCSMIKIFCTNGEEFVEWLNRESY